MMPSTRPVVAVVLLAAGAAAADVDVADGCVSAAGSSVSVGAG